MQQSPTPSRVPAALRGVLGWSSLLLGLLALHLAGLFDVLAAASPALWLCIASLLLIGATVLGRMDVGSIRRALLAPARTVALFPAQVTTAIVSVAVSMVVVAAHDVWGPWPGLVIACLSGGTLLSLLRLPREVYSNMAALLDAPLAVTSRSLHAVAAYLRRPPQSSTDGQCDAAAVSAQRGTTSERAILDRLEQGDVARREDLNFDAAGWLVVMLCLLMIVQAGTTLRAISLVRPDLFTALPAKDPGLIAWLTYTAETFLFRGEFAFDVYDLYGLDAPGWLGCTRLVEGPGLKPWIVAVHASVGIILAGALFSRFTFMRRAEQLPRLAGIRRFEARLDHPAYVALRALRPVVEARMARRVQRALLAARLLAVPARPGPAHRIRKWLLGETRTDTTAMGQELLCLAALLRAPASCPHLLAVVAERGLHLQVRLAALHSLQRVGSAHHPVPLSWETWGRLLDGLAVDPAAPGADRALQALCWLGRPDLPPRYDIVRAWCSDVLCVGLAPLRGVAVQGVPMQGRDRGEAVRIALVSGQVHDLPPLDELPDGASQVLAASLRPDRDTAICELLVCQPWRPAALLAAWVAHLGAVELALTAEDQELFDRLVVLRHGTAVERRAALDWLTVDRVAQRWRAPVTRQLLRCAGSLPAGADSSAYCDAVARLGSGPEVGAFLLSAWGQEKDPERWCRLLEDLARTAPGDAHVARSVARVLSAGTWRSGAQEPGLLRRMLCLQAPPEVLEAEVGWPTRINSVGIALRSVPPGAVVVGDIVCEIGQVWVADFPVTERVWSLFAAAGAAPEPGSCERAKVRVNWRDAVAFCDWLTARELELGLLQGDDAYRLPTEAEWQWFADAEAKAADGPVAQMSGARSLRPARRGEDIPNRHGLFGLQGNVWQWCLNAPGADSPHSCPPPREPGPRAVRGGSWASPRAACGATVRAAWDPSTRADHIGLRVVLGRPVPVAPSRSRTRLDPYLDVSPR